MFSGYFYVQFSSGIYTNSRKAIETPKMFKDVRVIIYR